MARSRSAWPEPTGMLKICFSEEAGGRFGVGITLNRGSAVQSARGQCSNLVACLVAETPSPSSLLRSSIPQAYGEGSRFKMGTRAGFTLFILPISRFAFKRANFNIL